MPLPPELQEKNDRLAKRGLALPPYAWWSTWTASKNRFYAPLEEENPKQEMGILCSAKTLRMAALLLFQGLVAWIFLKRRTEPGGTILKTFAYSSSFRENGFQDAFFGKLPGHLRIRLKERGEPGILTVYDPLLCFGKAIRFSRHHADTLPWQAFSRPWDLLWAFREAKGWNSLYSLMLGRAMGRLALESKPRRLILSTENNPWERITILETRAASPATKIIGYQHTVVPEASANMFPGAGEIEGGAPVPDLLLTVGEEPACILREYGRYGSMRIEPACAIRFEYLETLPKKDPFPLPKRILIALEGVVEAHEPLAYALRELKERKDLKIVIRTHPARPLELLERDVPFSFRDWENVEVSAPGVSLLDDLARSGIVYYWGSSVALEALALGIPLLHFDRGGALSYDPLFASPHMKLRTGPAGAPIGRAADEIFSWDAERISRERASGRDYLSRYFHPVTPQRLDLFLA